MRIIGPPEPNTGVRTWKIVPATTRVRFALREFMITTVRGSFREVAGVVRTAGDGPHVHVDVRIPVAGIRTGAEWRDYLLCSRSFLDAAVYPTISFLGWRIHRFRQGIFSIDGALTMRGRTHDISLAVTAQRHGIGEASRLGSATCHATTMIDRRDFGVLGPAVIEMGGLVIGRQMQIDIDLELVLTADGPAIKPHTRHVEYLA
jgi:polyisoprenoid-binding protein YceI